MDITHEMHDFFRSLCAHEGLLPHVDWTDVEEREWDEHDEEGFCHLSATREMIDDFKRAGFAALTGQRGGTHQGRAWLWLEGARALPTQPACNLLLVEWEDWTVFYMEPAK